MTPIMVRRIHPSSTAGRASSPEFTRRCRLNQPIVRSTTHRCDST